uniref:Uncharacterized protein n=1 Tax=Arundo donax TaxID=35708 RepID=A0A0A8ZGY2_ARUDO
MMQNYGSTAQPRTSAGTQILQVHNLAVLAHDHFASGNSLHGSNEWDTVTLGAW